MTVTINGTTGVAVPLGTAAAPGVVNTTSSTTGIYYPTSTTLALSTNGTNAVTIDASQNVGIGLTAPAYNLHVRNAGGNAYVASQYGTGTIGYMVAASNEVQFKAFNGTNDVMTFATGASERMRIDATGGARIGIAGNIYNAATSEKLSVKNTVVGCAATFQTTDVTGGYPVLYVSSADVTNASQNAILFYRGASNVGSIGTTASATTFNTSSDYRLKENVAPITTGLATISALKPVTYDWIGADEKGEGFIAHELQEIIPLAVTGKKDAVNEDGTIKSQGVDYSKIVVHLVAAIQELEARLAALESK